MRAEVPPTEFISVYKRLEMFPLTVVIVIPSLLVFPSAHQRTAHARPLVRPPAAVTYIPTSPRDPENRRPSDCIRVFSQPANASPPLRVSHFVTH